MKLLPIPQTLIVLFALVLPACAFAWPATVDHVADGDTVTVRNDETGATVRVRLAGIDAPETTHGAGRQGQPYGQQSGQMLAGLLQRGQVEVHPNGTTSYDRIVATITVGGVDGGAIDVGARLVAAGLAWNYPRYAPDYSAEQAGARAAHKGLWQQVDPQPPWSHRHHDWTN